jgi:hypothetical protein
MSRSYPFTTVVRLSSGEQLGKTMNRTWLDSEKIQPAEFRTMADAKGYVFTIGFRNLNDADRFRAQFPGAHGATGSARRLVLALAAIL